MHGVIQDAKHVYQRKVAVTPIVHSYHEEGEVPYQKFNCPVCEAVGNTHIGLTYGVGQCPLCGVHLNWIRYPEVGDEVVLTMSMADLPAGTRGVIIDMIHSEQTLYRFRPNEKTQTYQVPLDCFSLLITDELTGFFKDIDTITDKRSIEMGNELKGFFKSVESIH